MSVNVKVTVGTAKEEASAYSSISLSAFLAKEQLNATLQGIKSATGFDTVPTLLIEFPIILQEKIKMEELPPEFSYKETVVADKVYIAGKLKQNEGFFKNIESSFKEVTNLQNNVEFKLEVTHLEQWLTRMKKGHPEILVWFDGARLTGNISTDPKLLQVLSEILSTVCPEFINSPIFAALRLLDLVELEIGFDSFESLSKKIWAQFQETPATFQDPEGFVDLLLKAKEDFVVYLTLPDLVCVKFRAPCLMLGCFLLSTMKSA